jgi:signal peptidase II
VNSFSRVAAAVVAIGIFALDRWSKSMIETHLAPDSVRSVIPGFFNLVRSENAGVAFGMLQDDAGRWHTPALVLLSVIAIVILAAMLWKIDRLDQPSAVGLSLIFGGAVGNVYDRVRWGAVTDFLDFYVSTHHWYVFNLADSAICVGAGLLLLSMFMTRHHPETDHGANPEAKHGANA